MKPLAAALLFFAAVVVAQWVLARPCVPGPVLSTITGEILYYRACSR